ncbi:hypothetical protein [Porphyromonas sp.]|uniref:hypothetical protein n=1 Tax=Porphyromonas sp. TaxID=1924944 RepID=UPI0026DD6DE3|nr:hypothetical protein [Porphyromonas sp.]MDO4695400.1 hypothetical protein [Porphyromonas sp.]MDO4770473.1 hypothetical protein [Porphyromonas sp.]
MEYFVVKYTGPFGFIKPWSAVRDGETYSQQFLSPSIVEGMEKKLFPELLSQKGIYKIARHKLSYNGISVQQEKTQTQGYKPLNRGKSYIRENSIIKRGVMLEPKLLLAFTAEEDALVASRQHLCLCRNEDVVLPDPKIIRMTEKEFDDLVGFELRFESNKSDSFMVGLNRFDDYAPMYGRIEIGGEAVLSTE